MAVFAFYSFELSRIPRNAELLFPDMESAEHIITQEDLFRTLFVTDGKVDLKDAQQRRDGSYNDHIYETFNNDILVNREGIIVMTIEANKQKTTIIEKHNVQHQHNPFSHIIIDYREGRNLIAIQRNSAFGNKPDKLADIIAHTFNRLFYRYGMRITLTLRVREFPSFWDAVTEIRHKNHDRVKRISLDFSQINDENAISTNDAMRILSGIARKLKQKGLVVVEATDGTEVDLEAVYEDMINLADICIQNSDYILSVHFFSYGIYRFGAEVIAQFGIDERIIYDYVAGEEVVDLFGEADTLNRWMTKISDMLIERQYVAAPITEPASQQRRRR